MRSEDPRASAATDPLEAEYSSGARFWNATYGEGMKTDESVASFCCDLSFETGRTFVAPQGAIPHSGALFQAMWQTKWVHGACRIIQASDARYFSAMAQTKLSPDAFDELKIPYPAFAVRLPRGLIVGSDGREYDLAYFGQFDQIAVGATVHEVMSYYAVRSSADEISIWSTDSKSLVELLFADAQQPSLRAPEDEQEDSSDARIRELVRRAVVGLLYTMQHTTHWCFGSYMNRVGKNRVRREPPAHREVIIGRPIAVDVSEAVRRDAAEGTHASPTVQTLVRGHIKRQVCGADRADRKLIWIEPYWRGPEEAPILVRPYSVERGA